MRGWGDHPGRGSEQSHSREEPLPLGDVNGTPIWTEDQSIPRTFLHYAAWKIFSMTTPLHLTWFPKDVMEVGLELNSPILQPVCCKHNINILDWTCMKNGTWQHGCEGLILKLNNGECGELRTVVCEYIWSKSSRNRHVCVCVFFNTHTLTEQYELCISENFLFLKKMGCERHLCSTWTLNKK